MLDMSSPGDEFGVRAVGHGSRTLAGLGLAVLVTNWLGDEGRDDSGVFGITSIIVDDVGMRLSSAVFSSIHGAGVRGIGEDEGLDGVPGGDEVISFYHSMGTGLTSGLGW